MQGKRCAPPRGGGSAAACIRYILGEELGAKVDHEKKWNAPLTDGQKLGISALMDEARQRDDLGANAIWSPVSGGGKRPSSIYARGVGSLATAALDMEAVVRTQPRVKQPVQHYVISMNTKESKTITDEQLIRAAEHALDLAGWEGHSALFSVHRDTDNVHCHVALSSVNSETLKAWNRQSDYYRLHHALRTTELKFNMADEHGLAIVRDRGLATERIEWAPLETRKAWERDRKAERLEDMARAFLDESDGLESIQDRQDRLIHSIREYLSKTEARLDPQGRSEQPLRADIHAIAARLTVTLETGPDGSLHARLMERAPEGTITRQAMDSFGEMTPRYAKWTATDTVFPLDVKLLAPSPLETMETGRKTSQFEEKEHLAAITRRDWLSKLGTVEQSEAEVRAVVQADPGRVSRDIVASGRAVFSAEDIDRWTGERVSGDCLAISNSIQRRDKGLKVLSPDANHPLYTTNTQKELEQKVVNLATRLAKAKDPLFDRAKLDQAIKEEEKALGPNVQFSPEQLKVFDLLEYRFGMVQGDAGSGKTTLMAVQRRYCELTGREIAGFATSQLAAENLGKQAGIHSVNTARAQALESARGEEMIKPESRAILDEASMLSLESVLATLQKLDAQGAGGLFIGDQAQLPNLAAGDTGRLLASVAQAAGRYAEVTLVFRQKGPEVEWMKKAVPAGGRAIRDGDVAGVRAYFSEFIDRGHVKFHANRVEEIAAKASDVVEAVKRGEKVLAPGYSHPECLYANRAIRAELGHEGTGISFRLDRGVRELAPNDRVIFQKNEERSLGVLNGYTGTVLSVAPKNVEIELDGDNPDGSKKIVNVDPAKYRYLEYGWATTTHKSQGRGDPFVVPTLGKSDTARSAHVALTRCETNLHVHTKMDREALLDHLCSANSIKPKDDILFFDEIVRQTGGPDTYWAQSVRTAMEKEGDPLREEHRAETRLKVEARQRELVDTLGSFKEKRAQAPNDAALKRVEKEEKKAIDGIFDRHELESFVSWSKRNRPYIERTFERSMEQAQERKATQKLQVQEQVPSVKKGRGR
jgi:hypothetical protein